MKKGFTLVELLAVIVILAVILVIAVPQISKTIKQTKMNSLGSTAKLIASKAEEKEVENQALKSYEYIEDFEEMLSCDDLVKLDDECTIGTNEIDDGVFVEYTYCHTGSWCSVGQDGSVSCHPVGRFCGVNANGEVYVQ